MDQELQTKLAKRLAELPLDVREAILSSDFGKKVQGIGTRHGLHIDQIAALEDEVLLVMLAFSEPGEFVTNVVAQVHIPEVLAEEVAGEVSNELLMPIRESMKKFMINSSQENETSIVSKIPPAPTFSRADNNLKKTVITIPSPKQPDQSTFPQTYRMDPYKEPLG